MRLISARSSSAAGAEGDGEAGAGELGAALEVEDAELRPEVPVRLGGEVEGARGADRPLAAVGGLVLPHRHALVGEVRQAVLDGEHLGSIVCRRASSSSIRPLSWPTAAISAEASPPFFLTSPIARLASLRCRFSSSTSPRAARRSASSICQASSGVGFDWRLSRPWRTVWGSSRRRSRESMAGEFNPRAILPAEAVVPLEGPAPGPSPLRGEGGPCDGRFRRVRCAHRKR